MRHIHHSILLLIYLTFLSASFVGAQTLKNQEYYLRHNLIFFIGKIPEVSSNNIFFTEESICGFYPKVYESPILNRDTKVKIVSTEKSEKQTKIVFESKFRQYEISLTHSYDKEFKKAFDLIFSEKLSKFKDKYPKNRKQIIERYGFPIARCKENNGWFYILEFSPNACGSYDGCVIRMTSKGLIVSGYN